MLLFSGVNIVFCHAQTSTLESDNKADTHEDSVFLLSASVSSYQLSLAFDTVDFTRLDGFQNYRNHHTSLPVAHMGNNGLGYNFYEYRSEDKGIFNVSPAYSNYFFDKENIAFYRAGKPLTLFGYMMGAKSESYLKLFHTQNLGKYLNISANYHRLHSEGFYHRQLARQSLFNTTANFTSRDSAYAVELFFAYNSVEAFENGGLNVPDTVDASDLDPDLISINMDAASSITQNHSYYLGHSFDLAPLFGFSKDFISLEHTFHYSKIFRRYLDKADSSSALYRDFYLSENKTYDSTYAREFYNSFGLSFFSGLLSVHYKRLDGRYFQNHLVNEDLESEFVLLKSTSSWNSFRYGVVLQEGLSGYSKNDLKAEVQLSLKLDNLDKIEFNAIYEQKRPNVFLERYKSNHLFYDTVYLSIASLQPRIEYASKAWKTNFEVGLNHITNHIYFDSSASSNQFEGAISNPYIRISNRIEIGSKVIISSEVLYQQVDKSDYLPLPNLVSKHSLYYENVFFKESMLFQTGFQFQWVDDYAGVGYFPESNRIHLLQTGSPLGDLKQIDFFVNARIDNRFRLSLKLENLTGNDYNLNDFRVNGYPIPGKVYKIILSWALVN